MPFYSSGPRMRFLQNLLVPNPYMRTYITNQLTVPRYHKTTQATRKNKNDNTLNNTATSNNAVTAKSSSKNEATASTSLWQRFHPMTLWNAAKDQFVQFLKGTRLLFSNAKQSATLLSNGQTTYEQKKFIQRTRKDLRRVLPFSILFMTPGSAVLLPIALKYCPGIIPSVYFTTSQNLALHRQKQEKKQEATKVIMAHINKLIASNPKHCSAEQVRAASKMMQLPSSEAFMNAVPFFENTFNFEEMNPKTLIAYCNLFDLRCLPDSLLRYNFLKRYCTARLISHCSGLLVDDQWIRDDAPHMKEWSEDLQREVLNVRGYTIPPTSATLPLLKTLITKHVGLTRSWSSVDFGNKWAALFALAVASGKGRVEKP